MARVSGIIGEHLLREYGGVFGFEQSEHAITMSTSQLVSADPERFSLMVVNLGANAARLGCIEQDSANQGIYLAPNGGMLYTTIPEDLILPTLTWFARTAGGSSTLFVLQVRREASIFE